MIDTLKLIAPALAAGLVVAATHVPLGREVLRRGIIFLDLAVAQIAGLGAVVAQSLFHWEGIGAQLAAFACALGAAGLFSWLEKRKTPHLEAYIGSTFVLAAVSVILIFAGDPHGGEDVSNLLAGQILWVQWKSVALAALVSAPVLFVLLKHQTWSRKYFYPLFAACITLSVQMVGVYLVFASLILPALGAKNIARGWMIAALSVSGGLLFSVWSDLPSGAVMVWAYACVSFAAMLLTNRGGRYLLDLY